MNGNNQPECCAWRKMVWDCLASSDQAEGFKIIEGWMRCGKLDGLSMKASFPNCGECQKFYEHFMPEQTLEQRIETLQQMGCCKALPMIYDLDDNSVPEKVNFFTLVFADNLCQECQTTINLAQQKNQFNKQVKSD